MRLLNHVYGFGAKHKLLRAGIFGRVASRCLLLTFVGATKCLSFYVIKSTFMHCEQFVELRQFLFFCVLGLQRLYCWAAKKQTGICCVMQWDRALVVEGSKPRQRSCMCFLTGVSNSVCLMWILWLGCEAKILQSPFHRFQSRLRKPNVLYCCFLNKSVDLGCVDSAFASLVDCEAANFREREERTLFKFLR